MLRDASADPPPPPPAPGARRQAAAPLRRVQEALLRWQPLVAVGLLGYDLGRSIERLPPLPRPDDLGVAAVDLGAYDALYQHDAESGRAAILATDRAAAERLARRLAAPAPAAPLKAPRLSPASFETSDELYRRRVRRIQEHLQAGDCYQVNLCHRLRAQVTEPLGLYLRLRQLAPAPLGAFLRLHEDLWLLTNSPERLLAYDLTPGAGRLETRPIKGTRRRGRDADEDAALALALLGSAKDQAEHLMIVDLLRNDLGRVAQVGSVRADPRPRCVALPTVHHLISTVTATPAAEVDLADVLTALLPGGSITGAPKVRAMTIIDALEPRRRGPFYGALGWMTATRGDLSLCIRTAVVRGTELTLAVGGGVVLDSTPDEELAETQVKAAAFLRALSG